MSTKGSSVTFRGAAYCQRPLKVGCWRGRRGRCEGFLWGPTDQVDPRIQPYIEQMERIFFNSWVIMFGTVFFFQNVFHLSVSLVWWFSRVKSLRNSDGKTHSRLEFGATLDATFELWSTAEYSVHTRTEIRSLQDEIHSVHILQNVERHAWLGSVYTGFRSCNTFL